MPNNNSIEAALLIAKPGAMRDAWRALLTALPRIRDIEQVEDGAMALQAVARLHPLLLIVDATLLKGDISALLDQIKTLSPKTRRVVLVETPEQKQVLEKLLVDTILWQGLPAAEVAAVLERLLTESSD